MANATNVANYSDCFEAYERAQAAQAALTPVEQATARKPYAFGLLFETPAQLGMSTLDSPIISAEAIASQHYELKGERRALRRANPSIRAQLVHELRRGKRQYVTSGDIERAYEKALEAHHNDPLRLARARRKGHADTYLPKSLRQLDERAAIAEDLQPTDGLDIRSYGDREYRKLLAEAVFHRDTGLIRDVVMAYEHDSVRLCFEQLGNVSRNGSYFKGANWVLGNRNKLTRFSPEMLQEYLAHVEPRSANEVVESLSWFLANPILAFSSIGMENASGLEESTLDLSRPLDPECQDELDSLRHNGDAADADFAEVLAANILDESIGAPSYSTLMGMDLDPDEEQN